MKKNEIHHDADRRHFIPLGATMERFEIIGTPIWTPVWNDESGRYDIRLLSDIRFNLLDRGYSVLIKAGFVCDGASVPKRFWDSIGSPYASRYLLAAILHDALYQAEIFHRWICDAIFEEFMADLGVAYVRRNVMWLAVRMGGRRPWNAHTDESIAIAELQIMLVKLDEIKAFPEQSSVCGLQFSGIQPRTEDGGLNTKDAPSPSDFSSRFPGLPSPSDSPASQLPTADCPLRTKI